MHTSGKSFSRLCQQQFSSLVQSLNSKSFSQHSVSGGRTNIN